MNTRIRLAHRIAVDGIAKYDYGRNYLQTVVALENTIRSHTPPVVIIDNIYEAIATKFAAEDLVTDFRGCFPPFETTFCEWTQRYDSGEVFQYGGLVESYDLRHQSVPTGLGQWPPSQARFVMKMMLVRFSAGNRTFLSPCFRWIAIDDSGAPIDFLWERCTGTACEVLAETEYSVILMAFSFLSCKNVSTEFVPDDWLPEIKWQRRQGDKIKGLVFKTLRIDGIGGYKRSDIGAPSGEHNRFHICRGSFAEYTAEKPLFGKYTGRVWRPSHVKGSKDVGEVVKEYDVGPRPQSEQELVTQ